MKRILAIEITSKDEEIEATAIRKRKIRIDKDQETRSTKVRNKIDIGSGRIGPMMIGMTRKRSTRKIGRNLIPETDILIETEKEEMIDILIHSNEMIISMNLESIVRE